MIRSSLQSMCIEKIREVSGLELREVAQVLPLVLRTEILCETDSFPLAKDRGSLVLHVGSRQDIGFLLINKPYANLLSLQIISPPTHTQINYTKSRFSTIVERSGFGGGADADKYRITCPRSFREVISELKESFRTTATSSLRSADPASINTLFRSGVPLYDIFRRDLKEIYGLLIPHHFIILINWFELFLLPQIK